MSVKRMNTREKILEAAMEELSSSGYEGASIERIAARAGVSKGAVFHYFQSKYHLISEAMVRAMDDMWAAYIADIEKVNDREERLRRLIDRLLDLELSPMSMTFFHRFMEVYSAGGDGERKQWVETMEGYMGQVATVLRDANVPNPEIRASLLLGLMDSIGLQAGLFGDEALPPKELLAEEIYMIFSSSGKRFEEGDKS